MPTLTLYYANFAGGWADRMRIWITARGLAEITGREFRIVFESQTDPPELVDWGPVTYGATFPTERLWENNAAFLATDNLQERWGGPDISIAGNKMYLHRLRSNPHHCIPGFDAWVFGLWRQFYREVRVGVGSLPADVGIQIRAGDDWMGVKYNPETTGNNFMREDALRAHVGRVAAVIRANGWQDKRIFITSDCDAAFDLFDFPNKFRSGGSAYHYDSPGFVANGGAGSVSARTAGIAKTIGDHLTLINCPILFYCPWSGYGSTAALLGNGRTFATDRETTKAEILASLEG